MLSFRENDQVLIFLKSGYRMIFCVSVRVIAQIAVQVLGRVHLYKIAFQLYFWRSVHAITSLNLSKTVSGYIMFRKSFLVIRTKMIVR